MEVYAVQVVTLLFMAMISYIVKSLKNDSTKLADKVEALQMNTLTKEEVKEQIKLANLPLRVEMKHISEDLSEIKVMLQKVLNDKG